MKFVIYGVPFAKQSARFAKVGNIMRSYQPAKIVKQEGNVRSAILNQLPENFTPLSGPIRINKADFVFPILSSMPKYKRKFIENGGIIYKDKRPDLVDNLFKGLIDAMQGIVFNDDAQIVEKNNCRKRFGRRPRIEIELEIIKLEMRGENQKPAGSSRKADRFLINYE